MNSSLEIVDRSTLVSPDLGNFTFSTCVTVQEGYPDLVDHPLIQAVFGLMYSVVWVLGVAGNSLVIYMGRWSKTSFRMKKDYVLNLAISDLFCAFFSLPVTAITIFARVWVFPQILCFAIGTVQGSNIVISSFTLTLIAIDRCCRIRNPTRVKDIVPHPKMLMCAFWFCGYLMTSPMLIFSKPVRYWGVCGVFCEERWPPGQTRAAYSLAILLVQFGLPLSICVVCYASISCLLAQRIRNRVRSHSLQTNHEQRLSQRRRRTNRMMLLMVTCFVISYFPLNFVNNIKDFNLSRYIPHEYYLVLFGICHLISMTSIMWNPIIYGWFNEPFRRAVGRIVYDQITRSEYVQRNISSYNNNNDNNSNNNNNNNASRSGRRRRRSLADRQHHVIGKLLTNTAVRILRTTGAAGDIHFGSRSNNKSISIN